MGCTIVYGTSTEWKCSVTNTMCGHTFFVVVVVILFNFCPFKGGKWYVGIVLVFISLIMIEVEHIFMCLRIIKKFFLLIKKLSVYVFCSFFYRVFGLPPPLIFKYSLYIRDICHFPPKI